MAAIVPRRLSGLPRSAQAEALLPGVRVHVATTLRTRLFGLAGIDRLSPEIALLLPRTRSVHTFGMRAALDLVWLDRGGRPVALMPSVPPGRVRSCARAAAVIEVPTAPRRH